MCLYYRSTFVREYSTKILHRQSVMTMAPKEAKNVALLFKNQTKGKQLFAIWNRKHSFISNEPQSRNLENSKYYTYKKIIKFVGTYCPI